jgi:hypothetical protein
MELFSLVGFLRQNIFLACFLKYNQRKKLTEKSLSAPLQLCSYSGVHFTLLSCDAGSGYMKLHGMMHRIIRKRILSPLYMYIGKDKAKAIAMQALRVPEG